MSFFSELKRRNVFRVGTAYLVVAWLLIQVVDTLGDMLAMPESFGRGVLILLAIGFPVALIVSWVFEMTSEGIKTQAEADESGYQVSNSKLNVVVISGLSLAVVFLIIKSYVLVGTDEIQESETLVSDPAAIPFQGEITQTANLEKSIAVLPFVNQSNDPDQEYFSDGLSEEILNKLAGVRDLLVVARTSSFYFKGRNEDMRSIGEQLNVNYILEGSVRKGGNDLRITAQLIQADNGYQLWSDTYDRELEEIFAIQDEIAQEVTRALSITLGIGEFDRPGHTRNVAAHDALLKNSGVQWLNSEIALQAIRETQEALRLDPDYAYAWLILSRLYNTESLFPSGEVTDFPVLREEAFENALRLAPEMLEIKIEIAIRAVQAGRYIEAQRLMTELIEEYGTNNPELLSIYSRFLFFTGRTSDALPIAQNALRINPLSDLAATNMVLGLLASSDYDRAKQAIEDNADVLGTYVYHWLNWMIPWQQNDIEEYYRQIHAYYDGDEYSRSTAVISRELMMANLEFLQLDDKELARQGVEALLNSGDYNFNELSYLNGVANYYGDAEWESAMIREYFDFVTLYDWLPREALIRKTDAFKERMERLGLADLWRATGVWPDKCQSLEGGDDFECF